MHATYAPPPTYTGAWPAGAHGHPGHHHDHHGHGFCASCCHPRSRCSCGCHECRRESKELLVEATLSRGEIKDRPDLGAVIERMSAIGPAATLLGSDDPEKAEVAGRRLVSSATAARALRFGAGGTFIGGGCCVHLSVEYTPSGAADGLVAVLVEDSEDTTMGWLKRARSGLGYQIKEGIVTTKPGASLAVLVVSATARVRWCEVFSC